ncbi:MAG: thiamine phosphate synthase [Duncaniella sp.]|nr:thiamine phosphate synthase [Duncaniella sp.]
MLKIAITPADCADPHKEAALVCAIISGGWDRVHLRHPYASRDEMGRLIEAIPEEMHPWLVIHDHFRLIEDFNLGGLHLNRRSPSPPDGYSGPISRSCHSLEEAESAAGMTYLTLSPIFDSISKSGYASAFTEEELSRIADIPARVIALGGVTPERIDLLRRYRFSGFAMLGALPWGGEPDEMSRFVKQLNTI